MDRGGGWDPADDETLRRRMQRYSDDVAAIFREVETSARGRPTAEVRGELERRFRERDVRFPPDMLDHVARGMAEPWWPLRHPIEFLRWGRDRRVDAQSGDVFSDDDPEFARLERLLDSERLHVTGIGKFRTYEGWSYVVRIHPWSERRARRVR